MDSTDNHASHSCAIFGAFDQFKCFSLADIPQELNKNKPEKARNNLQTRQADKTKKAEASIRSLL